MRYTNHHVGHALKQHPCTRDEQDRQVLDTRAQVAQLNKHRAEVKVVTAQQLQAVCVPTQACIPTRCLSDNRARVCHSDQDCCARSEREATESAATGSGDRDEHFSGAVTAQPGVDTRGPRYRTCEALV